MLNTDLTQLSDDEFIELKEMVRFETSRRMLLYITNLGYDKKVKFNFELPETDNNDNRQ